MPFLTFYIHSDAPGDSLLRGVSLKLQEVTMQLLGGASFLPSTASLLPEQTLCWGADLSTDLEGERTEKKTLRMFCLLLRGAEGEKMNLWLNLLAINRWTPRVGNCVSVWSIACMKAGRIHLWDYFTWRRRRSALFLFHGCLPPLYIEQDFSLFSVQVFFVVFVRSLTAPRRRRRLWFFWLVTSWNDEADISFFRVKCLHDFLDGLSKLKFKHSGLIVITDVGFSSMELRTLSSEKRFSNQEVNPFWRALQGSSDAIFVFNASICGWSWQFSCTLC